MKLHIGCGPKRLPGYTNVDADPNVSPDVVADISNLPFDPESADEIVAIHVFEHLPRWEADDVIFHWRSLLRPGGKLVIEVPCLDKILENFRRFPDNPYMHILGLYGDQRYRSRLMQHWWCYSRAELAAMLRGARFTTVEEHPVQFHHQARDMRFEATR